MVDVEAARKVVEEMVKQDPVPAVEREAERGSDVPASIEGGQHVGPVAQNLVNLFYFFCTDNDGYG